MKKLTDIQLGLVLEAFNVWMDSIEKGVHKELVEGLVETKKIFLEEQKKRYKEKGII